ncbi:sigma-70 family RNA polymerase sigma factor [Intestinimonas butyriciproducens]|nr:sigma-70 family RNA polymerase sigma factor [Intestinimonas butyriciproducens]
MHWLVCQRRRLPLVRLKNREDTEDIFQTVFLKYLQHTKPFESAEHEKAWFIQVTLNACRDLLRFWARRPTVPLEELTAQAVPESEDRGVLEAVLSLPQKYRDTVYLHYYEGYSALEIGALLGRNTNTVYTLLNRARAMLREKLGGDEDG